MTGFKEFAVSFIFALGSLFLIQNFLTKYKQNIRANAPAVPVQVSGAEADDPGLAFSWGLEKVQAPAAWRLQKGSGDVIVAIIDTGCDVHHPDLSANIWRNPGESGLDENGLSKATNGQDDDGNGYADDFHGWNFVSNSPEITDDHGHGTHIAGIIGAVGLNGLGLSGVAPRVSLMILEYYDPDNSGLNNLNHTIRAIRYAVKMGAQIINYSGGGILRSEEEEAVLRWAADQGVIVVAAAGNEGLNSDFFHFYPAAYDLPNILSVTASDRADELLHGSNFGLQTVDLAAPGKNIYSTLPNGQYGYMTGTSQATAFATGALALILAQHLAPVDPARAIAHLIETGREARALKMRTRSGRVIDVASALTSLTPATTPLARSASVDRTWARGPADEKSVR